MLSMEGLMKNDKIHPKTSGSNPLAIPPNPMLPLSYHLIKPCRLLLHPPIKADQHFTIEEELSKHQNYDSV